jgi:hypothetical protein
MKRARTEITNSDENSNAGHISPIVNNYFRMNRILLLFVIWLLAGLSVSFAQKPGFYVKCSKAVGDTASKYVKNFERLVGTELSEAFHCATVNTQSSLAARLKWEKEYQIWGGEDELNVCSYLKCDYLVSLSMIEMSQTTLQVSATCMNFRKKENMADANILFTTSMNYAGFASACRQISAKLISELGKFEICAFTGPVSITINSELDSTKITDYAVYCNEIDQRFHKEFKINNNTYSEWELERKGIPRTEGTMTFYTIEESKIIEENGCYVCRSLREGGRTYTETRSMKVKGSGISHESSRNGEPQDDTRIELRFMENGKYLVVAKGTSQPVTGEDKVVTKAEGTCDNLPQETKIEPREIKIPLRVIFGPYDGRTSDKVLQQKDTKIVIDPVSKEKSTITIDFTLTQN